MMGPASSQRIFFGKWKKKRVGDTEKEAVFFPVVFPRLLFSLDLVSGPSEVPVSLQHVASAPRPHAEGPGGGTGDGGPGSISVRERLLRTEGQ